HYPLEFFGALITSEMDDADKVLRYINDCRSMGISIVPPDANVSRKDFSVSDDKLVFGLGAIKNVGFAAIDSILEVRKALGRFSSLREFCENVDLRLVNKRVIESLIKSGAMDSFGESRAGMFRDLQAAMELGQSRQRDRLLGQASLFDVLDEPASPPASRGGPEEEWGDQDRLKFEKETLGFYVSGHPLSRFTKDLAWFTDASSVSVAEEKSGKQVSLGGVTGKVLTKTTRRGDKMAIVTLEDLQGTVEVILFPELFAQCAEILAGDEPILVKGEVDAEGNLPKVLAKEVLPLADAKKHWKGKVHIQIRTPGLERETLLAVKRILEPHKGANEMWLHLIFPDQTRKIKTDMKIQPSDEVVNQVEAVLGQGSIHFE
ncbi:MAG: DNA polymerase III subunit alpha, partial [Nitrospinae bacterium]|nr:DNA polymerase III subunit alpha [Nitrospinota bacterium]